MTPFLRHAVFIIILMMLIGQLPAQAPRQITPAALEKIKKEVKSLTDNRRKDIKQLDNEAYNNPYSIEFEIDTMTIERIMDKKMDIDFSTSGMIEASFEAEKEYDKLLNKYFNILLKKLKNTDKETLKKAQRNWILYRDCEQALNICIADEQYSGGGTIQQIIIASRYLEITKSRVIELYQYLTRI